MRTIKSDRTLGRDISRLLPIWLRLLPICLSSLVLCGVGASMAAAILAEPSLRNDWLLCLQFGFCAALVSSPIVAICGMSAPRQSAYRVVLIGSLVCSILSALYFYRLIEALNSI